MRQPPDGAEIEDIAAADALPGSRYGMVASGRTSTPRHLQGARIELRLVVLLVAATIILTAGLTGRLAATPGAAVPGSPLAASASVPLAASASPPESPLPTAAAAEPARTIDHGVVLAAPVRDEILRGSVVPVRGVATRDLGTIRLRVMVADAVLGSLVLRVRPGPLAVDIPVFSPDSPLPVRLELSPTTPRAAPIVEVAFRIREAGPVDVWSVERHRVSGGCEIVATGHAPLTVASLSVSVSDGSGARASGRTTVQDVSTPDGGELFGEGAWSAKVILTTSAPTPGSAPRPLRLDVGWADPPERMGGSFAIPIAPCDDGSTGTRRGA